VRGVAFLHHVCETSPFLYDTPVNNIMRACVCAYVFCVLWAISHLSVSNKVIFVTFIKTFSIVEFTHKKHINFTAKATHGRAGGQLYAFN